MVETSMNYHVWPASPMIERLFRMDRASKLDLDPSVFEDK